MEPVLERGCTRRALIGQLASLSAALAQPDTPLRSIKQDHPRLIALDRDIDRVRALTRDSVQPRKILAELEREAERLQSAPVTEDRAGAPRLFQQSRHVLDHVYTLALLYRIDGKHQHLERAVRELHSAASFRNWNPSHFLDVAQMTHAFAIGYDWLYAGLSPIERKWMAQAIVDKGLNPALAVYERQDSWVMSRGMLNIVCNAGIGLGALALATEEPEKAAAVLRYALDSMPHAMASYAPDGGWPEGPDSWEFATRYAAVFLASLDSGLGVDFGLSNPKGFDRAGRFRMYLGSPNGKIFHFGGAPEESATAPEMFWLARRFNHPALSWHEQRAIERSGRAEPLDLVWYQRDARPPSSPAWPLDAMFASVPCASFRSAWDDPNALFLAVKGGDNRAARAHPDLGTFVFDAGGVRWAGDPRNEDGNAPGLAGSRRGPSRMRTEFFNTILLDGENQDSRAEARITRHEFTPDLSWVQIDLSRAYPAKVKILQRRIGMVQRRAVMINDHLKSDQPVEALWGMVTAADVSFDGQSATLQKDGWTLSAEIRTPRHAVFDVLPALNPADRKLVVRLGEKVSDLDLNVLLVPYKTGQPKPKIVARFPE